MNIEASELKPNNDGNNNAELRLLIELIKSAASRLPQFVIESENNENKKHNGKCLYPKFWNLASEMSSNFNQKNSIVFQSGSDDDQLGFTIGSICHLLTQNSLANVGFIELVLSLVLPSVRLQQSLARVKLRSHQLLQVLNYLNLFPSSLFNPAIWAALHLLIAQMAAEGRRVLTKEFRVELMAVMKMLDAPDLEKIGK